MQKLELNNLAERIAWIGFTTLLVVIRLVYPPRDLSVTGFAVVLDITVTLIFWLVIIFTHQALGKTIIRTFTDNLDELSDVLALPIGLGISGSIIGLFGMARILTPPLLYLYVIALVFAMSNELSRLLAASIRRLGRPAFRSPEGSFHKLAKGSAILIAGFSFLNALVPPWSYDALMYHLPGPEQFLAAGMIFPNLDNWYVNGPFAIEMLFTLGLALKDAIIPKLIHWSFGVSLISIAHVFAKRWFDEEVAWFTSLILLTIPIIPIISGFAYIDLAWATFEFGGFMCLLMWQEDYKRDWLILSGILLGLAAGSKYLGLMGLATGGLFFLFFQTRRKFSTFGMDLLSLSAPIIVISLPWYLKNWLILGNPVYPLYFGGPGWDHTRLELYMSYLNEFGTGRSIQDFLLLPWNIYARHQDFGAVFNRNDIPSVLFPLSTALVFLPRRKATNQLALLLGIRSILWAIGSHQIRFLLPIYPILSLLTAITFSQLIISLQRLRLLQFFFRSLTLALTLITLFYQLQVARTYNTLAAISGIKSKEEFLVTASHDFSAKTFLQETGRGVNYVLLLGDGRSYYCQSICIPDPDHFRWANILKNLNSHEAVNKWLLQNGITHILISKEDIGFLLDHDPNGIFNQAFQILTEYKNSGCFSTTYLDNNSIVYSNTCIETKAGR